jgi:rare lipoprotein A
VTAFFRNLTISLVLLGLSACSLRTPAGVDPRSDATGRARLSSLSDGAPEVSPEHFLDAPDAIPRIEPLHRFVNRPYVAFGTNYVPRTDRRPFRETGLASWYGKKYHGQKTATGETYDMFAMTAAHPTAPLPSYMRVTSLETKRTVVVRVNDRGPFVQGRIVDLSFAAAAKLGFVRMGTAQVSVELIEVTQNAPTQ